MVRLRAWCQRPTAPNSGAGATAQHRCAFVLDVIGLPHLTLVRGVTAQLRCAFARGVNGLLHLAVVLGRLQRKAPTHDTAASTCAFSAHASTRDRFRRHGTARARLSTRPIGIIQRAQVHERPKVSFNESGAKGCGLFRPSNARSTTATWQ